MSLFPGTKLGPYEIQAPLGAGGMGEVYRARDARLERSVAIKILPKEMSNDPVRQQRFAREAKTISSLNHPNICALYDVGEHNDQQFLVMEYLEGETLAQRLERGALPLEQTLRIAIEVTDALDRAHRQKIVHRDLKPGNIMLTKSVAKLLDFGLVRLCAEPAPMTTVLTEMAGETRDAKLTNEGVIVGTFQYMAPEQLEGREADSRTDLFAMGAVLYEMVTGRPAFAGRSKASLIAAILTSEPAPFGQTQRLVPPALERAVKHCLAKDPDERWQSAADLRDELRWIATGGSAAGVVAAPVATRRKPERLAWSLALAFALAAALAWWQLARERRSPPPPLRLSILLPTTEALGFSRDRAAIAISPDGKQLAYTARQGDTSQLYLRALDRLEPAPVPGSEGAYIPFFSPDSHWVGFFAQGKLKKAAIAGGVPQDICSAGDGIGASWGADDMIYFTPLWTKGIWRVPAGGGQAELVIAPEPGKSERSYLWPEVLPGGKAVLFTAWTGGSFDGAHIVALRLDTHERRTVIEGGTYARYLPTGHLVYARGAELLAVPFDAQRLEVRGTPVPVLDGLMTGASAGDADFGFSQNGTLLYVPGGLRRSEYALVWVDQKATVRPMSGRERSFEVPRLSPDGLHVAVVIAGSTYDIWLYDVARDTLTRLTFGGDDNYPVWSPDGKRIAFNSTRDGPANLYLTAADGSGTVERLTASEYSQYPGSWSPDGKFLAYTEEAHPHTGDDIWLLPLQGDRKPQPLLQTPFDEWQPRFSPDGRWLAYASNESGSAEVYVQPFPSLGAKWKISTDGGIEPLWAPTGRELFYRNGDKMMAVSLETRPAFAVSKSRLVFEAPYAHISSDIPNYDVAPDGQQFLMVQENRQKATVTKLNVVLNWFEELKQHVHEPQK
jgi:eukaryotic-like serine/threonine-protein kinase